MESLVSTLLLAIVLALSLLTVFSTQGQRFNLPAQQPRSPDLQTDGSGRAYVSAGSQLYRLNSSLGLEEARELRSEAVNISLSSDGRWLVVCLTDLSCEVYHANNFSAGHVFRRENVIISVDNFALFAAEDSFYVGGIYTVDGTGAQDQIILRRYGFAGSQVGVEESGSYHITRENFIRYFYGGFVRGSNAYYFGIDTNPNDVRNVRVMRVCHNSNFNALYELTLTCGVAPNSGSRISGVSVAENFAGTAGATILLSRGQPQSSHRNFVCLFSISDIDNIMERKFNTCTAATGSATPHQLELAWKMGEISCNDFLPTQNNCQFNIAPPRALDDVGQGSEVILGSDVRVDLGMTNQNFITASVAVTIRNFSFVFAAYTSNSGEHFVIGFDLAMSGTLLESNGFDRRSISDGPVIQLQWTAGMNFISASTFNSVTKIPIANCSLSSNCTSCLGNGNPLCGWCVVENKCSRTSECQNPETRWIRAAGTNTGQCTAISISPQQFDLDAPEILTLTLSQPLPPLLVNETYLCHFASDGVTFMVDAVGSGTTYTCNVTGEVPSEVEGLIKAVDVSLASSLFGIPFGTNPGALTIFQCSSAANCSQCLQTNSPCGWCIYNKVCSEIAASCVNGTENFLQPSMNQDFTDVCPLLDRPPGGGENYLQPVQVARNIELVTRNFLPEISGFMYACYVNGIRLSATYNNQSSLTCAVNSGQFILPGGIDMQLVTVAIQWMGQNSEGRNINHTIDILTTPTQLLLYNCREVATGCSSCIGKSLTSGFECGWCDRPSGMTDTCSFTGDCSPSQNLATTGSQCPMPMITDFIPKFGPPEGGTTIIITGTNLGVSFSDFAEDSIQVGGINCIPEDSDIYEPGRRISCTTTNSTVSTAIMITLSNGPASSGEMFNRVSPQVTGVFPPRGPQAGGTNLTVYGTNLNIGNTEDTTITLVGGTECTMNRASIQATSINCTTMAFIASAPPMSGAVMVMIDNATANNSSVQYNYTPNPEFYSVTPMNTILGGGVVLTFIGTNLDVVQNPMLVIADPQYLNKANSTRCTVINSTAISCVTPPLNQIQPGDVDGITYTIRVDNAPGPDPQANVSLLIRVLPNPSSFILIDSIYTTQDIETSSPIRIEGENLNSLSMDYYSVEVGGGSCSISFITDTQINCVPPANPPGGIAEAAVTVFVGEYLIYTLDDKLVYDINNIIIDTPNPSYLSTIIPAILVPLLVVIIALVALIIGFFYFNVIRTKRTLNLEMIGEGGESKANTVAMSSLLQSSNLQIMQEELIKQVPKSFIIPSSQLQLVHSQIIGQGEFGIVYKAQLINWQGHRRPLSPVAVKTLKGLFTASDVESMLEEIIKMKDLRHPNVMTLIGVCLDAGPGVSIVMPFMANGSLLEYLKKERDKIYLPDTSELEDLLSVRKLLLRMCHQVAKGMEYLVLNKFVHRDLAARNCMLNSSGIVKVGDFGLAEDVYTTGYFRQGKDDTVKLPFKWMAPESLRDGLFSEKSDVWSFGITCWEVFSGGRIPYSGVDAMSMLKILERGTRLEKPDNAACAPEIYSIIVKCWALNPEDRPDFNQLEGKVGKLLKLIADYMEPSMELLPTEESEELSRYENPETGEPTETEAIEDNPASGVANSGYDMTENSTYKAAGTQSSSNGSAAAGAPPTEDKPVSEASSSGTAIVKEKGSDIDGGGAATVNFDMTSNTAYSTASYN